VARYYGYKHPPRAIRDVIDQGVRLVKVTVKNKEGKSIASYRFDETAMDAPVLLGNRASIPRKTRKVLFEKLGTRCSICLQEFQPHELQVDHQIPYAVASDQEFDREIGDYMLLCPSCNRAKSWACEHCPNLLAQKSIPICKTCYWASPTLYHHVSLREIRRLDITWTAEETTIYESLKQMAQKADTLLPDFVKQLLKRDVDQSSES
jgi:5-methylcytosine-specific restriction endonuclease McrA